MSLNYYDLVEENEFYYLYYSKFVECYTCFDEAFIIFFKHGFIEEKFIEKYEEYGICSDYFEENNLLGIKCSYLVIKYLSRDKFFKEFEGLDFSTINYLDQLI